MKKALTTSIQEAPLYEVPRPEQSIHFVAKSTDWSYCEKRLRAAKIIGIDTETRPDFRGKRKRNPCSLLQLATRSTDRREEVFILDLLNLPPKQYNATLAAIFLSKKVIKLGQGLEGDLKELAESYPAASCFKVAKAVVEVNDMSICLAGGHLPLSLQKLVFLYLDKRLTKTQQTSNWNRRPLTTSQLHYAAGDALVLIHIFDELQMRLKAKTNGKFKIEAIQNVLDVHLKPTPKCTLCFDVFEDAKVLKTHRKECLKDIRKLEICAHCGCKFLLTPSAMEEHTTRCGAPNVSEATSPDDVSQPLESTTKAASTAPKRKRKRLNSQESSMLNAPETALVPPQASKKRKKNKKTSDKEVATSMEVAVTRVRKMSEGTLLASDDIWTQISQDHASP